MDNRTIVPNSKLERRETSSSSSSSWSEKFHFPSLAGLRSRTSANSSRDLNTRSKFFGSRSQSPAPLAIRESTFYEGSPASPHRSRAGKRNSAMSTRGSSDYKRYSGTVNHYGRHSNDWLFGGFSLRDTVRDGVEKLLHNHDKES
ncbi:hypothetical protein C8Q69DRAFT_507627 [Paecilomyces variotii]|uniref:Uncharacterized protein n=1 Tax=Byssochlamys spectabilis TaxID=264951 RepID=A0A443HU00_BYSSP|nr:hypothetical protein C8Q69DRAFT_507627 [Paecilomyces variotii]KAJ9363914.1 hypothetical protein DTO280E4_2136 [Paecilomyces variotii]RWQ95260.1 hypothetical protein C8Q69DRAFT_507627 [Paecilomyces variotii]